MAIVIVQGMFVLDLAQRDQFIEASLEGMRTSRAEPGCLEYVFAADPLDPGRVILSERWESLELLQLHLDRRVSRPARDRPKPKSSEISMYEVASVSKLV